MVKTVRDDLTGDTEIIYLTTAANDKDLKKHFQGMAIDCPIPFGDFIFKGFWVDSEPISICGERKHLPDLLQCINDNRHLEQIRGARGAGFTNIFLVVEDQFRETSDGDVELYGSVELNKERGWRRYKGPHWQRQGFDSRRLESYLIQLEYYGGVRVFFTRDARETAHRVINIYRTFQKPPEEHASLVGFHEVAVPVPLEGRPSLMRRVFKELHGIGWVQSGRAEEFFKEKGYSLVEALMAGEEWQEIERVGPEISRMIKAEVTGK